MKQNLFLLVILAILVSVSACKKTDTTTHGTMTASIDGSSWEANIITDSIINGAISIYAKAADNSHINIYLNEVHSGVFQLNDTSFHSAVYIAPDATSFTTSYGNNAGGEVNITDLNFADSIMSGIFSFIAVNPLSGSSKNITNGKFLNLSFKSPLLNIFHAVIDGTFWKAGVISGNLALGGKLTLKGSVDNGAKFITIVVPGTISNGTYTFGGLASDIYGEFSPDPSSFMYSYTGTLVITKHDTSNDRIEGTFEFKAVELTGSGSSTITEGAFRLTYSKN